jgi:hypothetical protein
MRISHIEHDAAGSPDDASNAHLEWVEICNDGPDQPMNGWTLKDAATNPNTYPFPQSYTLSGGTCVKVRTGTGADSQTNLYWGRSQHVWNQDHDTARLHNGSTLVAQRAY